MKIIKEIFDFSVITFEDSKTLTLTLENESSIKAKLIVYLREFPEFELMLIEEDMKEDDLLSEIMVLISEERQNFQKIDEIDPDDIQEPLVDEDAEEEEEEEEDEKRYVQINLKPYVNISIVHPVYLHA